MEQHPPMNEPTPTPPFGEGSPIEDGKTIAIVSYLTLIGLVAALIMNGNKKNTFAAYHIRQSLGLMLTAFAISLVNVIPIIGQIVWLIGFLALLYLWIVGLMNAVNGKEKPLPFLGDYYSEWFKTV